MNILKQLHHFLIGQFQLGFWNSGNDTTEQDRELVRQRREEEKRKADISSGIRDIDLTFAKLLDPSFQSTASQAEGDVFHDTATNQFWARPSGTGAAENIPFATREEAQSYLQNRTRGSKAGITLDYQNAPLIRQLEEAYLNFASPEVDRQALKAGQKVGFQLARRGTTDSSMAAEQSSEIERQKGEAMARIASRASEIGTQRARDIEKARQGIISQLEASGNATAAANAAINQAGTLGGSEAFEPLGQVFNVGLATGKDVLDNRSQPFSQPTIFSRSGKGSSKVIS